MTGLLGATFARPVVALHASSHYVLPSIPPLPRDARPGTEHGTVGRVCATRSVKNEPASRYGCLLKTVNLLSKLKPPKMSETSRNHTRTVRETISARTKTTKPPSLREAAHRVDIQMCQRRNIESIPTSNLHVLLAEKPRRLRLPSR